MCDSFRLLFFFFLLQRKPASRGTETRNLLTYLLEVGRGKTKDSGPTQGF